MDKETSRAIIKAKLSSLALDILMCAVKKQTRLSQKKRQTNASIVAEYIVMATAWLKGSNAESVKQ